MRKITPYSILALTVITVILLYEFKWSYLYPSLSFSIISFMIFLITICLVFSGIVSKMLVISVGDIEFSYNKWIGLLTFFVLMGTLLDGIYSHGFPLFGTIKHGDDYGIPTFHVLLLIFNSFLTYYLSLIIIFKKKRRFKPSLCLIINLVCLLLPLSRMLIILTILNVAWSFFYLEKKKRVKFTVKRTIIAMVIVVLGLYIFGLVGNYRTNIQVANKKSFTDSSLIYQIGFPTEKFQDSKIPPAFFWDYVYITSPLANLQNIVRLKGSDINTNVSEFIITQFLPDVIGKRLYSYDELSSDVSPYQVSPILNVSTTFYRPFYMLSWFGVGAMLLFMLIFPLVYLMLLKSMSQKYFVIGLSILDTIYCLLFFDNMFTISALSLQLIIPLVLAFRTRNSEKNRK